MITPATFPNYRVYETELGGRKLKFETGKMAGLANGAVLVTYGETVVLCTATMAKAPRDGIDFFPLGVDFEEKLYAVGRIPGSFMHREGRPGEKAILVSDVGITPQNDGTVIRLNFPQLTEERRKQLAKQVKGMGEEAKVALRNIRRDANDEVKKAKKDNLMTEDEVTASEKAIQDVTDKLTKQIDTITAAKEKELMAI